MRTKSSIVRSVLAGLAALGLVLFPVPSAAHPMGNFSISHYADIRVEQGFIELQYLIDAAEIPTFQEMQQHSFVAQSEDPRVRSYLSSQAETFKKGLLLTLNGQPLLLETVSQSVLFSPGAGNLPTMKFGFVYRAQVSGVCAIKRCELEYHDDNFSGRLGWKEVITSPGRGITIENSSAPLHDRSNKLSNYPTDLINSPPQDVTAKIVYSVQSASGQPLPVTSQAMAKTLPQAPTHSLVAKSVPAANPGATFAPTAAPSASVSPSIQLKPNQQVTPRNSFTELIATRQISFAVVLLAAAIAAGLGALHALEPGHGKTIVAAYLVGSQGTARHALLLGMIVTISHTAGVYLLGAITLYAQKYILPERIYPFLGVLSGVLIAGMGCYLFLQRYLGDEFSHKHDYSVGREDEIVKKLQTKQARKISTRQLVILGLTGGIIPCPAALVVLLSAIVLHRTVFGLYLIVAFSLGLAGVLIAMGVFAVHAGRLMSKLRLEGPFVQKWLPMGSAAMITFLGCGIALRSLITAGLLRIRVLG